METIIQPQAHVQVVEDLKSILNQDPDLQNRLIASLQKARDQARANLNKDLYHAIDNTFEENGWPVTIEAYYDYIEKYVRLIPNESNDPNYPHAWKSNDQRNGYNQKVYDLLCQFYYLIDQQDDQGQTMQSNEDFAEWLVEFARAWGSFLDTEESLTTESLQSFKRDRMYNFHLYSDSQPGWKTFNNFFYREFNGSAPETGITPLRPIADPDNNTTIVSPADCTYKMQYNIDDSGNVVHTDGRNARITLKHTHTIGTVKELLDQSEYADDFNGGTFVHYFLSPFDYHRFHTPVSGKVLDIKPVVGKVYLNVNISGDQFDAPDGGENGYEFVQARGMVIIDAGGQVGKVAILPIGMCQVSGVDMYTNLKGQNVLKGQEFGKFRFGGSDIIMLFQKNPGLFLFKKDPGHTPIHFQYGQAAAYWNLQNEQ
ncbi:phosphatidylserine decarboxylase [Roseivirga sp. BDSF3-8]|uniref:phosphatidylserine decarboxylase n=1 Tax=Roseivirga sp. BDSF3-8 TaxID=3241598 RepID=UPI003531C4AF